MRLTTQEQNNLKNSIQLFDKQANLYLFGSRIDDKKKGGDIDIMIISKHITRHQIRKIKLNFYDQFGEQQIDILLDDGSLQDPFKKLVYVQAIKL